MSTMLLASTGGHLAQLHRLRDRLAGDDACFWVTFDSPQSRSLLADEDVVYVPYVAPRDWRTVAGNLRRARAILREREVTRIYSTGSGIALSFMPLARTRGIACHYVESAARSTGPSVTGRIMARVPGVRTYTQYHGWASKKWPKTASVFDDFLVGEDDPARPQLRRVVVTLGTIQGYGFRSLVDKLLAILPPEAEVLWQVGDTDVSDLPITSCVSMPQSELTAAIQAADVVVAHSGIGSALGVLGLGKVPVLVPRSAARDEHVDDHQIGIARELAGRDLAIYRDVDDLTLLDLPLASRGRVQHRETVSLAPPA
ncbi:MAG: glycosyltransferase 28 domain protein [Frankiales bacterium]|nr:glycosyltransferase 28 domain protein [Frankiales bacterium]